MPHELVKIRRDPTDWAGSPLELALHAHVDGEVRFDRGARALYATDASNYREVPIGVVVPRTIDAVVATVALCREHGAPILARGGGTSLAGQTCNHAVVIDFSRHLTKVVVDDGFARVQPGTIMKSLRDAAQAQGWDFGPDPSTKDRCTLGGMLGNNSCGVHSVFSEFYGPGPRTSDHVEHLDVLTYRGERMVLGTTHAASRAMVEGMRALGARYAKAIRARFPDMPRIVSGYNLLELLPESFHPARALVGSEATLAIFLGATLRLMPAKPGRALVVLGYPDIYSAAEASPRIRELRPIGCEAFDDVLAEKLRKRGKRLDLLPAGKAWLFVEHGASTTDEARALAAKTAKKMRRPYAIYTDKEPREHLADVREEALGVDAFGGGHDTYEGWEDSAVPPERLAGYLRELHALYARYDLHGSLYGHFGQGCVHTRIDFDLRHPAGIAQYRAFTRDAAHLVVAHGGSLSGEHGDGQSKADLHDIMFGPDLVGAFHALKDLWDPDHKLNPGKMVWPSSRTSNLRLATYDPHPGEVALSHGDDGKDFGHAAVRCVGIGKCRKRDAGTMCPSYMVTLDEQQSTRGRAHLLFEMLDNDVITDGWRSKEVREALDTCLSCKACKHECPTHVDMASYKAEFLSHHYKGRLRPRNLYAFGWIHRWLALARAVRPIANWLTHAPGFGLLLKWLAGVHPDRDVPWIHRSFRSQFVGKPGGVILWADTFNDAFYPEILQASARVLELGGYKVDIPSRRMCCGRPMFEAGWIEPVRRMWAKQLPLLDVELPIVGIEPSCTAMLRDELRALFPGDPRAERIARHTKTLGELLGDWQPRRQPARRAIIQRHCHAHAVLNPAADIALLERAGLDVDVLDSGCCGMAGAFGFERDHYALSTALAERVLLPAVRDDPDAIVIADGFSCREQLRQLTGVRARHVAEVLAYL